jgi:FG-GAP-like repeat/Abnormal spindle-like microcephaly-assoc'd, ASPM-SPD-2-Hydin
MTRSRKVAWNLVAALCLGVVGTHAVAQFETRASASTGTFRPVSLTIGDFNRDGKLDVAVLTDVPSPGEVMIFLGNGDGTFSLGASYAVAVQPLDLTAASLKQNGVLDLVVGDEGSYNVYVMMGNGDGTFQSAVPYPTSGNPLVVGTGDFIGHGKLDIVALTRPGAVCACVEVLPGNGDGTFQAAIITPIPYNIDGFAMATSDFNGDGKLDVAVSGGLGTANQVDILLGNGDGSFTADGYYPVSLAPYSVAASHFKGGKSGFDLAVGNLEDNSVSVLLGNGDGTFQQAVKYDTWAPNWVAIGDLNGDGKEDLVVANYGSPTNQLASSVSVLSGNGDGTFKPGVAYLAGESLTYVAIGDFNGDHKPDLVAVDALGDAVITLLNTGVVSFSPTSPLTFATQLLGTTSAPLTATLTNNGTTPLTISSIHYTGKPFHMRTTCGASVAPGGSCTITATFSAETEGVTTGTVTIHDSASSKPQFVELTGTGTAVKLQPHQLTFPPQKAGTKSHSQNIRLTNIGSTALDFTRSIYIQETENNFFESNNCPTSLAAGASCSISVIFAPRKTGTLTGSVIITDTGGGSPQSVPLTGTGD